MDYFTFVETVVKSLFIFISSLCIGSFLDCVASRTIKGESALVGRSKCDFCGHKLNYIDLIPVIGFLRNKGKCRYCGNKLSVRYPIGEILYAVSTVSLFIKYGLTADFAICVLFVSILFICSLCDIQYFIIPNRFVLLGFVVCVIKMIFTEQIISSLLVSFVSGLTVSGFVLIVAVLMEKIRNKRLIGGGDIKLLFIIGMNLFLPKSVLSLLCSCLTFLLLCLIFGKRKMPFAPFLSFGYLISVLFGDFIIDFYLSLYI